MDNENEITLDNGNKIVISLIKEKGYSITKVYCFRAGDEMNIRQNLLDIIEGCQKELEVIMNTMKSNYPICKTCKFRNNNGFCHNPKINDSVSLPGSDYEEDNTEETKDMLIYSYDEAGSFFVGEEFGCIHHEEKA